MYRMVHPPWLALPCFISCERYFMAFLQNIYFEHMEASLLLSELLFCLVQYIIVLYVCVCVCVFC